MSVTSLNRSIVPVFAGGGTRLPAYVGVLEALKQLNVDFDQIVGVSGGSIVAALIAAGKTVEELKQLALTVDFRRFRGYSLYHLFVHGGLSSGNVFEKWLKEQLGDVVFSELPLPLHVVATDLRTSSPVVFNRELTPTLSVVEAVRCSMGIPLIFTFREHSGKIIVDGSILAEDTLQKNWSGNESPTCFFRIKSLGPKPCGEKKRPLLPSLVVMLIRTFMTTVSREFINDTYWNSTIVINAGALSPIEFSLTEEEKESLYLLGYKTTMRYLPQKLLKQNG